MKRLLAGLIVSLCAVFMTASVAQAATTPTPQYTPGNPTCPTAGLLWSHKWDPPVAGWNDAGHKVHVLDDLKTVDAIDMTGTYNVLVIVKGGDAANIYTFENIDNVSGLNMQSPLNNGGNVPVISHVTLCKYSPDGPPPPPPVYDCDGNRCRLAARLRRTRSATRRRPRRRVRTRRRCARRSSSPRSSHDSASARAAQGSGYASRAAAAVCEGQVQPSPQADGQRQHGHVPRQGSVPEQFSGVWTASVCMPVALARSRSATASWPGSTSSRSRRLATSASGSAPRSSSSTRSAG